VREQPDALYIWAWESQIGTKETCDDPTLSWAKAREVLAMAKDIYRSCQISVDARSSYSMRYCLELRHADLQAVSNHGFWKDTAAY
jgi:hypothetical protein